MGSLDRSTDEALSKWTDDIQKRLGTGEPVAYVVEPKIDGLAVNLTYETACSSGARRAETASRVRT